MTPDIFETFNSSEPWQEPLTPGAVFLHKYALCSESSLLNELEKIISIAPFRQMITPGGFTMSVSMTSCGTFGWVSENSGYRYDQQDPLRMQHWPPIPQLFLAFAADAAKEAGFSGFSPDTCLINRYHPGAKLGLHQDKNERDLTQPIVSVSLGIPAVFLFGGFKRSDKTTRLYLTHGDVVVWGGPSRLRFHGVLPVKDNEHPTLGKQRINLTFRKTS